MDINAVTNGTQTTRKYPNLWFMIPNFRNSDLYSISVLYITVQINFMTDNFICKLYFVSFSAITYTCNPWPKATAIMYSQFVIIKCHYLSLSDDYTHKLKVSDATCHTCTCHFMCYVCFKTSLSE